jgi:hypothetical protein
LDLLLAGELFIVAIGKDKRKFICTQKLIKSIWWGILFAWLGHVCNK